MNGLILLSIFLSVLLGVGRSIDLAWFTDPETGLCLAGTVWLRYASLGVAVLAAVLAGWTEKAKPGRLCSRCVPSGTAAMLGAVFMAAAGLSRLALIGLTGPTLSKVVWTILVFCCAGWLFRVAKSWLRQSWKNPTRSLTPAVFGSAVFYWCVLARFMENSSSWHRVAPTATVWQMLAALVFLSGLIRALYLPDSTDGKMLCAGGLTSFALCLCWELPGVAAELKNGLEGLPEVCFGLALCCVGALGGLCALRCAAKTEDAVAKRQKAPRHSVG